MAHTIGHIPVRWTPEEIRNLNYFYEEFNDSATLKHWTDLWGYSFRTGLQADFRSQQPAWIADLLQDLADQGHALDNVGTSFYMMRPGDILPRHHDTYARYCRHHGVAPEDVWRAIIFLQDWQPGFLFEVDDRAVTGYTNGTYVGWHNDAPHLAGNVGSVPRYTLQVTGTKRSR